MLYSIATLLCWFVLGAMIFFGSVVAPTVFTTLQSDDAGRFLRKLFPRLYLFCGVLSAVVAVLFLVADTLYVALSIAFVSLLFFLARGPLTSRINQARDEELAGTDGAKQRFDRLHKLSVRIFGLQALILVIVGIYASMF